MGSLIYLVAGYAVFWVVLFVFIYTMVRRQRQLEQEIKMLEQLANSDNNSGE